MVSAQLGAPSQECGQVPKASWIARETLVEAGMGHECLKAAGYSL